MFVITNLSYRWGGEGVRVSQKKNFSWIPFSLKYQCKKKAPIETQSLCQVLNMYDCKALIQSKRGYVLS